MPFQISTATSVEDLAAIKVLFEAYTQSLGIDLTYLDYATELSRLPGKYSGPAGTLLLARDEHSTAIGCVALRLLLANETCEMKRLYVTESGRGLGLGRALAEAVIEEARRLGYKAIRLDTLPTMRSAQALYASLGFERIEPYYSTPIEGTVFLEKRLTDNNNKSTR